MSIYVLFRSFAAPENQCFTMKHEFTSCIFGIEQRVHQQLFVYRLGGLYGPFFSLYPLTTFVTALVYMSCR